MKTFWLKGRTGPIKGLPKKNKIIEKAPEKKDTRAKVRRQNTKTNLDPPPARMRTVKEEASADKAPTPKPPSPKRQAPKTKSPSPKKEPVKSKPPSPKKEPVKPRSPSPKKEPLQPKAQTPMKELPKQKSSPPKKEPKPPTPKKEQSPQRPSSQFGSPKPTPSLRIPEKQGIPTKQVEPITIAVSPAARENRVQNTKISPTKETIFGKKVYEDGSDIKDVNRRNDNRNGKPSDSPVISEKMNGSKASVGLLAEAADIPKGKAQSCTCNIL